MDNTPQKNIVETALAAGRDSAVKVYSSPLSDGIPFIILNDGEGKQRAEFITQRFDKPARKSGSVNLNDEASFMEYWKLHSKGFSNIFGCIEPAQFIAIFNDHYEDEPGFRDHRAVYKLAPSKEWLEWTGRDKQKFDNTTAFAEWLENHLPDMLNPPGAKMMEIALNMRVTQNASYSKVTRLQDGDTQFTYTNTVEGNAGPATTGQVNIPDLFTIAIPVFQGLTAEQHVVEARFRYRLHGSTLSLWYELVRPHKVIEKAFEAILSRIQTGTKKTVLFGSPSN